MAPADELKRAELARPDGFLERSEADCFADALDPPERMSIAQMMKLSQMQVNRLLAIMVHDMDKP